MHLTQRSVEKLEYQGPAPRRDVRWDTVLPGFGVRVYASGRKVWVISYRAGGVKRLMSLGTVATMPLEEARKRARKQLVGVADGKDPLAEAQRAACGETLAAFCQEFLEKYSKIRKKTWKDDARMIARQIAPRWGTRKLEALPRADVVQAHRQIGVTHPYAANRLVELISRIYEIARDWGVIGETYPNPARRIKPFPEVKRDRFVTTEEMPRLAAAIDAEINPFVRAAFWLYLLTGLRKRELLRSRWQDIDLVARVWRIPETKSGRIHYLPIHDKVIAVLSSLPRCEGNPHVLPGLRAGQPLENVKGPWERIRHRAGLPDVRVHDLRRTAGSLMAQQGVPLHLIGRILNHKDPSTTAIYARFQQRHEAEALTRYADHLLDVAYPAARDGGVALIAHAPSAPAAAISQAPQNGHAAPDQASETPADANTSGVRDEATIVRRIPVGRSRSSLPLLRAQAMLRLEPNSITSEPQEETVGADR
jgi:integrase